MAAEPSRWGRTGGTQGTGGLLQLLQRVKMRQTPLWALSASKETRTRGGRMVCPCRLGPRREELCVCIVGDGGGSFWKPRLPAGLGGALSPATCAPAMLSLKRETWVRWRWGEGKDAPKGSGHVTQKHRDRFG